MTEISTFKLMLNKAVSDDSLTYSTFDLHDMYLMSKLDRPEYMWMPIGLLPMDLRVELGMQDLPEDYKILCEVLNAFYGMAQAGPLAQRDVISLLTAGGYYECQHTTCLFKHRTRDIMFVLWVDDVFVLY